MHYDIPPDTSRYSADEMRSALHYLARMMKAHPNAKKLVPVYKAIKQRIQVLQETDSVMAEAIAFADTRSRSAGFGRTL